MHAAPRVVWLPAAFFAASGLVEIAGALIDAPRPIGFWPLWEALGRGSLHFVLALGLWRRVALCRAVAVIYCLAILATYGIVLGLALTHAPLRLGTSVVLQSLFQVPSCTLLFPYLRSAEATSAFVKPLLG